MMTHMYKYRRCLQKKIKPLWKVKGFLNRTLWKVSDVQIVRYTWVLVVTDKSNHRVADSSSVPQESWSGTTLSGKANDWRIGEHVLLNQFSHLMTGDIQKFLW